MAKGQISKEIITNKLLEVFEGSFNYDKEIRIPMIENGEEVQIKVTLTAAKTNVSSDGLTQVPGAIKKSDFNFDDEVSTKTELTQEEKDNVARLAKLFDL